MKNLKKKSLHFFKILWPYLLITFIVILFFWKFFIKGLIPIPGDFVVGVYYPWLDYKWGFAAGVPVKNPILTDVVSFTYPMQTLAIDLIKSGKLPLWNPYILAGTPLLANFQSSPFSPTNFLYFLTDKITAWSLQIVLQHLLAAFFTFILLRHWKISKFGSVVGSIVYAFGGFNLIWSQWNGHALSASFIPLLFFLSDKFLLEGKLRYGVGVSISFCLMILSGYPQIILYLGLSIFVLCLLRFWKNKYFFKKSFFLAFFFLIGLGLSAFQIFPGAELLKYSQREVEQHPFEWAFLPIIKVITFIAPNYFGNHSTRNYWGPQDYTSNTGFVGVIAFILSGYSLLLIKNKKEVLFTVIILFISLILSFPTPLSIFLWKSGFLGLNAASAHRSLVIFNLSIAILSGFGFDYLFFSKKTKYLWVGLLAPGFLLILFLILAFWLKGPVQINVDSNLVALRNLVIPIFVFVFSSISILSLKFLNSFKANLVAIELFVLMIIEIFNFGWKFTPFSKRELVFPTTPVLDFLMTQKKPFRVSGGRVIPVNMLMPYNIESLGGYDAVYPLNISKFISLINAGISNTNPSGRYGTVDNELSPLIPFLNVKYFLAVKKDINGKPDLQGSIPNFFDPKNFKKVFEDKSTVVLENVNAFPRAFVVFDWDVVKNGDEALNIIVSNNFPRDKKIILLKEPPIQKNIKKIPNAKVEYLQYGQGDSLMKVNLSEDGMLFISDTFYPGWKAYIDGKETEIFQADYAFRAIAVSKGEHAIKFVYRPESFFNGIKVSLFSLVVLMLIIGYTFFVKKRDAKN